MHARPQLPSRNLPKPAVRQQYNDCSTMLIYKYLGPR
jgi:hypothetical protein